MRPRVLPIFLLLALLTGPLRGAAAQAGAPPPPRDTAYAVHNLFKQHRQAGVGDVSFGAAGLSGLVFEVAHGQGNLLGITALTTVVSTALAWRQLTRFSESREGLIVRRYEQGWPVPNDVRRRLRAKHFRAR